MLNRKNQKRTKKLKDKKKKGNRKDDQYFEDIIDVDENVTKDFQFLVDVPVSVDNYFVSKSEQNWNVDVSKYSEYFMLDLTTLSAAIESIPFNENVNIDTKYFTNDQLTNIYNDAEHGKEKYNQILNKIEEQVITDTKNVEESQDSVEDTSEDLDFLLSLEEPVNDPLTIVKSLPMTCSTDSKTAKSGTPVKSIDLEKWLDSVLSD